MSRSSSAEQLFRDHANCAQSVLLPFAEGCGMGKATAMHIASGFGGGMARLQGPCGALTGACMALGIAIGAREPDPTKAKDATSAAFRECQKRFVEIHGATTCRELLQVDLSTEEGRTTHAEARMRETICTPCVRDAARIVDEFLNTTA